MLDLGEIKILEEEPGHDYEEDDDVVLKVLRGTESDDNSSDEEDEKDKKDSERPLEFPSPGFSKSDSATMKLGKKMNAWLRSCLGKYLSIIIVY